MATSPTLIMCLHSLKGKLQFVKIIYVVQSDTIPLNSNKISWSKICSQSVKLTPICLQSNYSLPVWVLKSAVAEQWFSRWLSYLMCFVWISCTTVEIWSLHYITLLHISSIFNFSLLAAASKQPHHQWELHNTYSTVQTEMNLPVVPLWISVGHFKYPHLGFWALLHELYV